MSGTLLHAPSFKVRIPATAASGDMITDLENQQVGLDVDVALRQWPRPLVEARDEAAGLTQQGGSMLPLSLPA